MACDMPSDVKTFMLACDQLKEFEADSPLYWRLIKEEFDELTDASTRVEELDACMDLIWVILGYAHARGFNVEGGWNEVTRSNMSKIDHETGKVNKREDGKVLKPATFSPPNLEPFI
jgi:predicted HAD superfamily Cof-like phosphohydrolase